jgi:cytochrome c oxidase assembly protein subunit 11
MSKATRGNRLIALAAAAAALIMVGASFAAVPLYRIFCQVTGFGGTTQVAGKVAAGLETGDVAPSNRVITVSLLGNVNSKLPWTFEPATRKVSLRVGESALVFYRATNRSSEAVTGVATFNVTPHKAGPYFAKVQCFCFTKQTLKPGETVDMPVTFFIDPDIEKDRGLNDVTDIALSYTFFRAPGTGSGDDFVRATQPGGGVSN